MSATHYLRLLFDLGRVASTLVFSATFGIIFRPARLSYRQYVFFSTLKAYSSSAILGKSRKDDTYSVYKKFVQKHGLTPRVTPLQIDEARLCWLGSPNAQHVMYYLHGGGYVNSAVPGHFLVQHRLIQAAERSGKSLQVAVLHYGLAPTKQYPRQLQDAVAGLRYLVEDLNISSENIIIAGDSAGGNLSLGLLSHLMHPHPQLEPLTFKSSSAKLMGAFLLSPWVTFMTGSKSFEENSGTDFIASKGLTFASKQFLGASPGDNYSVPLDAPVDWWKNLIARNIGVSYGDNEVFADDIVALAKTLKAAANDVDIAGFKHESHVQSVFDATMGWSVSKSEEYYIQWTLRLL